MNRKSSIVYIGNKLSKKGVNPTTIDTLGPKLEAEGYTLYYASDKQHPVARMMHMLFTIVKYRNANVMLIDTYSTWAFYFALASAMLSRFFGIRYIPILHGGNLPHRISKYPRLSRQVFKNSFINVVVSRYLQSHLEKTGYRNVLIPNNIDLADYPFLPREMVSCQLLWVRSFDKIYNPQMAVSVFAELLRKHPDATLTMVGPDKDGSMADCKALATQLNIADRVTFTGKLTKNEWITLSRQHDIFINTSNFDNLPVSLIEAMALGLPVISTNVGGIPFLIEHEQNGLLVQPGDTGTMIREIEKLLQSKELFQLLTKKGREKAETYDWQHIKHQWNNLLQTS